MSKAEKEQMEKEVLEAADVIFTTYSSCSKHELKDYSITHAIVDETALGVTPDICAVCRKRYCSLTLCGDEHQLPPSCNEKSKKYHFGESLFNTFCKAADRHHFILCDKISTLLST